MLVNPAKNELQIFYSSNVFLSFSTVNYIFYAEQSQLRNSLFILQVMKNNFALNLQSEAILLKNSVAKSAISMHFYLFIYLVCRFSAVFFYLNAYTFTRYESTYLYALESFCMQRKLSVRYIKMRIRVSRKVSTLRIKVLICMLVEVFVLRVKVQILLCIKLKINYLFLWEIIFFSELKYPMCILIRRYHKDIKAQFGSSTWSITQRKDNNCLQVDRFAVTFESTNSDDN